MCAELLLTTSQDCDSGCDSAPFPQQPAEDLGWLQGALLCRVSSSEDGEDLLRGPAGDSFGTVLSARCPVNTQGPHCFSLSGCNRSELNSPKKHPPYMLYKPTVN
ncbi:hypothetical protein SKAU_G00409310 [Synaphobranchus kaupii]|uniref:Uncharacterized protein n=1 Tax=Synaphobranchus kaupii TaxID=118154 RepID=A0A9Q1EAL5_SYNKA|nr:hypothetical protein SKAU_G00409310 [Synaphobranchus kaupii]